MKKILALVTSAVLISSIFASSPAIAKIKDHDFKVEKPLHII